MPGSDRHVSTIFAQYWEALFRYVARYTGDPDLADDVVQETLIRFRDRPPTGDENVRGWLFTVATNAARDALKVASRRKELILERADRLPRPAISDPASNAERADLRRRLRRALDALSDRERTVLLMHQEGCRHREIAEAVGTTTRSVGTMIARAVDRVALAVTRDVKE